ncbi:MAG: 3-hydroxyacyl-ACP dehydratase FabZ family protein [Candidatus Cryosericum sp.]|nr:beta-hydroxyacyl-ACP dehydratase [bacterium]
MDNNEKVLVAKKRDIESIIPQRDPFLFVDELTEVVPGKSASGRKTFSGNEEFFKGHFPGMPIVPGVILIEMAAQVAVCIVLTAPEGADLFGLFASVEKFRFLKQVVPKQTLLVTSKLVSFRHHIARSECNIYRDDVLVAGGVLNAAFVRRESLDEGGAS